ncbi:hypothetical protein BJ742DRAFT_875459 [Cladochytrium replicatum]|nr:hypothetical protein BJ742DRAFT_875459 [Cladochytrium replicatum]
MHIAAVAAILAFAPSSLAAIQKIVSFGDSLTDTGVVAGLTKDNGPSIPSSAYFKGRFSNGPVWLDYLVESKSLAVENFAAGGATTSDVLVQGWVGGKFGEPLRNDGSIQTVPGVDTQIRSYIKQQDPVKTNILYTVFAGANDNFDNQLLGLNKDAAYFAAAQYDEWKSLVTFGAAQILSIVLSKELDPFYELYGSTIDGLVTKFRAEFPEVKIFKYEIPVLAWVGAVYSPPLIDSPAFCCTDCFNGLPPTGNATICDTPDAYLIWDSLHPTTKVHKFIADDIAGFIQSNFGF